MTMNTPMRSSSNDRRILDAASIIPPELQRDGAT
jgi:hypothetical protein